MLTSVFFILDSQPGMSTGASALQRLLRVVQRRSYPSSAFAANPTALNREICRLASRIRGLLVAFHAAALRARCGLGSVAC